MKKNQFHKKNTREIEELDRVKRINLINSVVGIRPINLIATQSKKGIDNLAIFSSLIHLGSSPAILGFISRPIGKTIGKVRNRDTLNNIRENPLWTVNSIHEDFLKQAHSTSAKIPNDESEFDICKIEKQELNNFPIPFVAKSKIKIAMHLKEILPIETNGTFLIVGEVMQLMVTDKDAIDENGILKNEKLNLLGTIGCSSYYRCQKIEDYPFIRFLEKDERSFEN